MRLRGSLAEAEVAISPAGAVAVARAEAEIAWEGTKMDEAKETLKLAGDMKALRAEHGTDYARKRFRQIVAQEFEKAKTGEVINLSSLFCAKESLE